LLFNAFTFDGYFQILAIIIIVIVIIIVVVEDDGVAHNMRRRGVGSGHT